MTMLQVPDTRAPAAVKMTSAIRNESCQRSTPASEESKAVLDSDGPCHQSSASSETRSKAYQQFPTEGQFANEHTDKAPYAQPVRSTLQPDQADPRMTARTWSNGRQVSTEADIFERGRQRALEPNPAESHRSVYIEKSQSFQGTIGREMEQVLPEQASRLPDQASSCRLRSMLKMTH